MSCDTKPSCKSSACEKGKAKSSGSLLSMLCGRPKNKDCGCAAEADTNETKCPPMPCFNTGDCKPDWLCNPPKGTSKTYPVPCGATIVPISKTGRSGAGAEAAAVCGACGRTDDPEKKKKGPDVKNKECPAIKPKCPPKAPPAAEKKESVGFFAKIFSFFGGKK